MRALNIVLFVFFNVSVFAQDEAPTRRSYTELANLIAERRVILDRHRSELSLGEVEGLLSYVDEVPLRTSSEDEVVASILAGNNLSSRFIVSNENQEGDEINVNHPFYFRSVFGRYLIDPFYHPARLNDLGGQWEDFTFFGLRSGSAQEIIEPRAERLRSLMNLLAEKRIACNIGQDINNLNPLHMEMRRQLLPEIEEDISNYPELTRAQRENDNSLINNLETAIETDESLSTSEKEELLANLFWFGRFRGIKYVVVTYELHMMSDYSERLIDELNSPCDNGNKYAEIHNERRKITPNDKKRINNLHKTLELNSVPPAGSAQ